MTGHDSRRVSPFGHPRIEARSSSPRLIAAYDALHRLPAPRHPPYALSSLTIEKLRNDIAQRVVANANKPDYSVVKDRASSLLRLDGVANGEPRVGAAPSASSVGRAPALQAGGQRFESAYLHHVRSEIRGRINPSLELFDN